METSAPNSLVDFDVESCVFQVVLRVLIRFQVFDLGCSTYVNFYRIYVIFDARIVGYSMYKHLLLLLFDKLYKFGIFVFHVL